MDTNYASVEQLDNPILRGKTIAVGGREKREVIIVRLKYDFLAIKT